MDWPVKGMLLLAAAGLAACATAPADMQLNDLRRESLMRDQRVVEKDFAQIQSSLFKHQAACGGSAARLQLQRGETSYGWLIQKESPADGLDKAVIAELTLLDGNWRVGMRTRMEIYSYYYDSATKDRVRQLLVAIVRPGNCDPDAVPYLPDTEERGPHMLIDSGA